ncbi:MAG: peptidoglycan DD-metalloendopeptidase family protein [Burkholderiales bacterium]|nr:peptidoglycan DD-metalloendopeptidase family protein [Burkholderiales bacterium]
MARLRGRIAELQAKLTAAEDDRVEAADELRESERAISNSNRAYRELARHRLTLQSEIESLGGRMKSAQASIAARESGLGRLLAAGYMAGRSGYLKLFASGSDPSQTSRDLYYLSSISKAYAADIDAARAALERLHALESAARERTTELARLEHEAQAERQKLQAEREARRRILARVSAQIRGQRREVAVLERDELRLARLVEALGRAIRDSAQETARDSARDTASRAARPAPAAQTSDTQGSFAGLKGLLRLPVRGSVTSRFGTPRQAGGPSWKGIFIRAPEGSEVRAVAPGRVVFSDWLRGVGNVLILDHGQGYLSIYGNNESLLRRVGEQAVSGDALATVGASGGIGETGLYFEIRHEGTAFDPLTWILAR